MSPTESWFWPGVGVLVLRDTPTPAAHNESYNENVACRPTLLYIVVHLLLEEFRLYLHSTRNTQSLYITYEVPESELHKK